MGGEKKQREEGENDKGKNCRFYCFYVVTQEIVQGKENVQVKKRKHE